MMAGVGKMYKMMYKAKRCAQDKTWMVCNAQAKSRGGVSVEWGGGRAKGGRSEGAVYKPHGGASAAAVR